MALISRKPYCNNCMNRGSADPNYAYRRYPCCVAELAEKFPEMARHGVLMVTEKMRCPDKTYFVPTCTKEQQKLHNNHK